LLGQASILNNDDSKNTNSDNNNYDDNSSDNNNSDDNNSNSNNKNSNNKNSKPAFQLINPEGWPLLQLSLALSQPQVCSPSKAAACAWCCFADHVVQEP